MKKVFSLFFVTFCFGFIGLVLWVSSAHAQPPGCAVVANNLGICQGNLNACEDDLAQCEAQPPAPVPQTGQTTMYVTGDDGDIQAGVALPNPRFTDNGDGTITDNLTHLIWLKDANCLGGTTMWQGALDFANGLYDGCPDCGGTNDDCDLSDGSVEGDWRLPNVRELHSLINYGFYNPALSDSAGTAQWSEGDAFTDVQSSNYWSSTTFAFNANFAWFVFFLNGNVSSSSKSNFYFVLPVRGGS